ncbi:MAG: phosphatase PAP2 family protein [Chloroflexi bacterium]|nr:phosphatase PAP2 family protein [Chloroflexota bacterium]
MPNLLNILVTQLRSGDPVLIIALLLLVTWAGYRVGRLLRFVSGSSWGDRYAQFASQVGTLLSLEQAYELTRGTLPRQTDVAYIHAYRLLDFEWRHGFFVEMRLQHFFLQFHTLMSAIDLFYILGHLVVTIGATVWIFSCRRPHYPFVRNLMVVTTAIALAAFYVYPTAPPRLLPNYGFVDPAQLYHLLDAGGAQPGSYTYNPYAAMPSLHVAYALIVAWGLLLTERHLLIRLLVPLYPVAMAATVVISANHWLLDVAGAVVTVGVAATLLFVASLAWRVTRAHVPHPLSLGSLRPMEETA